ncbi:membrane or secreted protein [Chitinophaga sp. G-6-1-13]|uniref:Membrane or secreted protein n=1 Tax=Chitinophaga fulva TaxID=2728842 RepID=A0A848GIF0_9BACT|nr:membrane or secreted protein [Chitinophaga fulva]NML37617.1 membrane or secreted protein [Chitinophaga fulva]
MRTLCLLFSFLCAFAAIGKAQDNIRGAWKSDHGGVSSILLITPNYFSITSYKDTSFIDTMGGTWKSDGSKDVSIKIEFNTEERNQIGWVGSVPVSYADGKLFTNQSGGQRVEWTRVDNGDGPLAGSWQITGREQDGKMNTITPGARKTVKILTGTRFQWVAINTDTGEFFGTGGGTYTFQNGVYTEKIDFFSRDNSRVGASLTFKGKVDGNSWDHSGLSSKGEPIHEVWQK